jgi:hypothetical protein
MTITYGWVAATGKGPSDDEQAGGQGAASL